MINQFIATQFASGKSLARSYMNWHVTQATLSAPILDIGAGEFGSASYHALLAQADQREFFSVDIVPDKHPTKVADVQQRIPFDDNTFRTCLAFNLLEHVYDFHGLCREAWRVLAPAGIFYISVPFLLRVHADPDDYFRYTASALHHLLSEHDFHEIVIESYGGGALTAALSQIDFLAPRLFRRCLITCCCLGDQWISKRSGGKYRNAHDYPLGYFVRAQKTG